MNSSQNRGLDLFTAVSESPATSCSLESCGWRGSVWREREREREGLLGTYGKGKYLLNQPHLHFDVIFLQERPNEEGLDWGGGLKVRVKVLTLETNELLPHGRSSNHQECACNSSDDVDTTLNSNPHTQQLHDESEMCLGMCVPWS